jgi:hypothetical protein
MGNAKLKIEVVLPATASVGPFWIDARSRRPPDAAFSELPRTTVLAAEHESLRAVLGRAGDSLGVGLLQRERATSRMGRGRLGRGRPPSWEQVTSDPRNRDPHGRFEEYLRLAAFVRPGDEDKGPAVVRHKGLHLRRVATVGTEGLVRWDKPPLEAAIGELARAGEAGLLDGDPLRPYLIVAVPAGDLGVIGTSWDAFEDAFQIVWAAISAIGTAYSASQAMRAIKDRLTGAKRVLDARRTEWAARGGRPSDLPDVLGAKPRFPVEVAALLGCSESEAEALMWGFGFHAGPDGRWRPDIESQREREVLVLVQSLLDSSSVTTSDRLREEAEDAARRLNEIDENR